MDWIHHFEMDFDQGVGHVIVAPDSVDGNGVLSLIGLTASLARIGAEVRRQSFEKVP